MNESIQTAPGSGSPRAVASNAGPAGQLPVAERWSRRLDGFARGAIAVVAFLAPIAVLPVTFDPLFFKVGILEVGAVLVGTAWLAQVMLSRRITYTATPLNIAFLALAAVLVLAAIFSAAPFASLWGADQLGEKTATVLAFLILAFAAAALFERRDAARVSFALAASFALLGLYSIVSIAVLRISGSLPGWLSANPVGTANALAAVLAFGFLFGLVLLLARAREPAGGFFALWLPRLAAALVVMLFPLLVLSASRTLWVLVGAVAAVVIAGSFAMSSPRSAAGAAGAREGSPALRPGALAAAFLVLLASAFFAFKPYPFAASVYQPPLEVSPSLRATLAVDRRALYSNPVLGFGPANFRLAYNRFRDTGLNTTVFWAMRFGHGFSHLSTVPATLGLAGLAAFSGLILVALVWLVRAIARRTDDALAWAFGASSFFGILSWVVLPANAVMSFLTFLGLGVLGALLRDSEPAVAPERWRVAWQARRASIAVATPALTFIVSLGTAFAAAAALVVLYTIGTQYAAEVYARRADAALRRFGNADTAAAFLDRARRLNPQDDRIARARAAVGVFRLQRVVAESLASPNQDASGRFRDEFSLALGAAREAAALSPRDSQNWAGMGQLYEAVLPYLPGADRAALQAYQNAADADPTNPLYPLLRGRVHLAVADLLTLQIYQTAAGDRRSQTEALRAEAYRQAGAAVAEAVRLKSDLADAHFLLAQIAMREENVAEAIRKSEEAARLVPADVGVAFQLGVLYYRAGDLDKAKAEFERAILYNESYSNARYFLGLIWDRKGDTDAALSQFQKIAQLNPGNKEVEKIMANLEAGRSALSGIAPPLAAPEARREAPVQEIRP